MCYKDEQEQKRAQKFEKKIKGYPAYIKNFCLRIRGNSTKLTYLAAITHFLEWLKENQIIESLDCAELKKVTDTNLIEYSNALLSGTIGGRKYKISTVLNKHAMLKAFWVFLQNNGWAETNIVNTLPKSLYKQERESIVRIPTTAERKKLITGVLKKPSRFLRLRNIAILALMAGTGLRSEELLGCELHSTYLSEDGSETSYVTTKRKGYLDIEHQVEIEPVAVQYIMPYFKMRQNMEAETDALFLSKNRKRLDKSGLDQIFSYNCPTIHAHMMRDLFATDLYTKTKDLVLVQKRLNHKNPGTTANMYISIKPEENFFSVMKKMFDRYKRQYTVA